MLSAINVTLVFSLLTDIVWVGFLFLYCLMDLAGFQGKCLTKCQKQCSFLVAAFDWLWARTISLILWPLHMLAKKLVYNKIQTAIGISKVLFSMFDVEFELYLFLFVISDII